MNKNYTKEYCGKCKRLVISHYNLINIGDRICDFCVDKIVKNLELEKDSE